MRATQGPKGPSVTGHTAQPTRFSKAFAAGERFEADVGIADSAKLMAVLIEASIDALFGWGWGTHLSAAFPQQAHLLAKLDAAARLARTWGTVPSDARPVTPSVFRVANDAFVHVIDDRIYLQLTCTPTSVKWIDLGLAPLSQTLGTATREAAHLRNTTPASPAR